MADKKTGTFEIPTSESEKVEFKLRGAGPEKIAAAACAFLNSDGGTVYIGIQENGKVLGVEHADEYAHSLRIELQKRISPKALWSVNVEHIVETQIVTIEVPAGHERPYVCDGTIYVRQGEQGVAATAEAIHQMVGRRHRTPFRWEREPAAGVEIDDLDDQEINNTIADIRERARFTISEISDKPETLYELGLMQSGVLTNACAFLFGKNPARYLPQTRVRATVFSTDKRGDFVDDHVFEGHAFALLNQLVEFLKRNVRTVAEFEPGKMQRTDRPEYPLMALREGIMNALTHRDYSSFDGGMAVGVYPDRIEIWNSGTLPEGLTVGALKRPHPSLPPNPDIAHVFYLRGLIERIGRGTIKIVEDCKAAKLPSPTWTANKSGVTLTIGGRRSAGATTKLNHRQTELLGRLTVGKQLVPSDYYEKMAGVVSQRQAQRDLSGLEAGGWLRQEGDGPATVYVRTEQSVP